MSDKMGDVYLELSIRDVDKSIAEAKAEIRKARFEGTLTADTAKFVAEAKAAIKAVEQDKAKIGLDYESLDSGLLLRRSAAISEKRARQERADAKDTQDYVNQLIGNGLRQQVADARKAADKRKKDEEDVAKARRKAEFAAYRESDARDRKAVRDRLKALKLENAEMARVLGSGQRPQRGSLMSGAKAFADRSPEVVAKYNLDLSPAERKAQEFRERLLALRLQIKPGVDMTEINRGFAEIDAELAAFQDEKDIPVHIVGETRVARAQIKETLAQVREDGLRGVRVRLVSEGNLTKIRTEVDKLRVILKQPLAARVVVKDNIGRIQRKLRELQAETALTNPKIGRMQAIIAAIVLAAGPAAIALGGVATAIGAIGTAVVRAVGSLGVLPGLLSTLVGTFAAVKVGSNGVTDAFKAFTSEQQAAAKETVKTLAQLNAVRNAQEALADAKYSLGQTKTQGDDSINALLDQRIDLNAQLKAGELSIRRAEADRAKTLTELNRQLRDLKLNEDDAAQSVRDAQIGLNNASILGDPEEIKRASIALQKAKNAASDMKQDDGTLLGGGADLVRDEANAQAQAALDAQTDLNKQLTKLDNDLTKQRIANARAVDLANRSVRDAGEALTDAQAEAAAGTKAQTSATNELAIALSKLSPNAREFVNTVNELRGAWLGVRTATQDALFEGAAAGFRNLTTNYVPILTVGLAGIATAFNGVVGEFGSFFNSTDGLSVMKSIFDGIKLTLEALQPAIKPFLDALTTIIDVSLQEMPGLVGNFTTLLQTFNDFIQGAADDGSLATWITDGVTALGQLISLVFQLGTSFSNIVSAMDAGSGIQGMIDALKTFNAAIDEGGPARSGLIAFFNNLATATELVFTPQLASTIGDIFSAFGENLVIIAPSLRDFLQSFTGFIAKVTASGALTSILDGLLGGLSAVFDVLARPEVIDAIAGIADAFGQLLAAIGPVFGEALGALLPIIASIAQAVVGPLTSALDGIAAFIRDNPELIAGLAAGFGAILVAVQALIPILVPLIGVFGSLIVPLITLLTGGASLGAIGAAISAIAAVIAPLLPYILGAVAALAALAAVAVGVVAGLVHLYQNGGAFKDTIVGLIGAIGPLFDICKAALATVMPGLNDAWQAFSRIFDQLEPIISKVALVIGGALIAGIVGLAIGVAQAVNVVSGLFQALSGIAEIVATVIRFFYDLGGVIYEFFKGVFTGDFSGLSKAFHDMVEHLKDGFLSGFSDFFGGIVNAVAGYFTPIIAAVKAVFGIHSPSTVFAEIGTFIVQGFMNGLNGIGSAISGWISQLVGFFSNLGPRIASGARGAFDGLVTAFKGAVNLIIDAWNRLGFSLTLPDKIGGVPVPFIGGKSFTIATPDIPRLAQGGTTTGPTLALIGDNKSGRERVKPEDSDGFSTDTRILDGKLDSLGEQLANVGGQQITLVIGGGVREVLEQLDAQHARGQLASGGYSGLLDRLTSNGSVTELDRLDARTGGLAARALSAGLATIS